jgi:hypothetical protein
MMHLDEAALHVRRIAFHSHVHALQRTRLSLQSLLFASCVTQLKLLQTELVSRQLRLLLPQRGMASLYAESSSQYAHCSFSKVRLPLHRSRLALHADDFASRRKRFASQACIRLILIHLIGLQMRRT